MRSFCPCGRECPALCGATSVHVTGSVFPAYAGEGRGAPRAAGRFFLAKAKSLPGHQPPLSSWLIPAVRCCLSLNCTRHTQRIVPQALALAGRALCVRSTPALNLPLTDIRASGLCGANHIHNAPDHLPWRSRSRRLVASGQEAGHPAWEVAGSVSSIPSSESVLCAGRSLRPCPHRVLAEVGFPRSRHPVSSPPGVSTAWSLRSFHVASRCVSGS